MKLRIHSKTLNAVLGKLNSIPGTENSMPTTNSIIIEASMDGIYMTRTTLIATMKVETEGEIDDMGEATVSAHRLRELAQNVSGAIEFKKDKAHLVVSSDSGTHRLGLIEEKPVEHALESGDEITIEASVLAGAIKDVSPFMAGDEKKGMNGVMAIQLSDGAMWFCCGNGVAFGAAHIGKFPGNHLLPKAVSNAVLALCGDEGEATLSFGKRTMSFTSPGVSAVFLGLEDEPPQSAIAHVFKKHPAKEKGGNTFTTDREGLIKIVKAALPLGSGDRKVIEITFGKERARISAIDKSDSFEKNIEGKGSLVDARIHVPATQLIDGLNAMIADEVAIQHDGISLLIPEEERMVALALSRAKED